MRPRIAIVGGGIAGLTAGWLLCERYDVVLYERSGRLGGNAWTYRTRSGVEADIAVAAFGRAGYPTFFRLLATLAIRTRPCVRSMMSFHDLDRGQGLYLTPSVRGLLAQRLAILHPRRLERLAGAPLALLRARAMLHKGELDGMTVEQILSRVTLARHEDARTVLMCIFCLLSSMSGEQVASAPARFFIGKLDTHHDIVTPRSILSVRAVQNLTKSYVEALAGPFRHRIALDTPIEGIERDADRVTLRTAGKAERFDAVVLASNADQALGLLKDPSEEEQRLLGAWQYRDGRVVVHGDLSAFPSSELIQAYTFLYRRRGGVFETSVNGSLWHEPGVPSDCRLVSSQHPNFPIRAEAIEADLVLRTPVFDFRSVATIPALPSLNGRRRTWFCGSYFGYGLHEDAVRSAAQVAAELGGRSLW